MSTEFLTPGRTKVLRRLLLVIVVLAGLVLPLALLFFANGAVQGGIVLTGIAAVMGTSAWLARNAVTNGAHNARRLSILTAVLTLVFSLPLVSLLIGLFTAIAGIGLMFVVFVPEREPRK